MVPVTDDLWPFPPPPADPPPAPRRQPGVRTARSQDLPVVTRDGPPIVVTRDEVPERGRARFRADRNRSWAARRDVLPTAPADPEPGIWIENSEDDGSGESLPVLLPAYPARDSDVLPPSRHPAVTDLFPPRQPAPGPTLTPEDRHVDMADLDNLFPLERPGPAELDDLFPAAESAAAGTSLSVRLADRLSNRPAE